MKGDVQMAAARGAVGRRGKSGRSAKARENAVGSQERSLGQAGWANDVRAVGCSSGTGRVATKCARVHACSRRHCLCVLKLSEEVEPMKRLRGLGICMLATTVLTSGSAVQADDWLRFELTAETPSLVLVSRPDPTAYAICAEEGRFNVRSDQDSVLTDGNCTVVSSPGSGAIVADIKELAGVQFAKGRFRRD